MEQIATAFYTSARNELIERIKMRDRILILTVGFTVTIFGLVFDKQVQYDLLLLIPYLSTGAIILIYQHNSVIEALAGYCKDELEPVLQKAGISLPNYDNSKSLKKYKFKANFLRTLGNLVLLILPSLMSLILVQNHGKYNELFGVFAIICFAGSCLVLYLSHLHRKDFNLSIGKRMSEKQEGD